MFLFTEVLGIAPKPTEAESIQNAKNYYLSCMDEGRKLKIKKWYF